MIRNPSGKVLFYFWQHGLGDCVQFTIVLQHLRDQYPNLTIDVATGIGKHSCFSGLVNRVFIKNRDYIPKDYDQRIKLDWFECDHTYADLPSTKPTKCLFEVFGIVPTIKSYQIHCTEEARQEVNNYVATLPAQPFVCIHYQGNSSTYNKNLDHDAIKKLCEMLLDRGITPLIIDFDYRSPLPDQRTIFCPNKDNPLWGKTGTGDAATLAALVDRAALFIGVDSGPLHVAQATSTPIIACWTRHHPVHFSDISGNVTHLVPSNHAELIRGHQDVGLDFFTRNYDYRVYEDLEVELLRLVAEKLDDLPTKSGGGGRIKKLISISCIK